MRTSSKSTTPLTPAPSPTQPFSITAAPPDPSTSLGDTRDTPWPHRAHSETFVPSYCGGGGDCRQAAHRQAGSSPLGTRAGGASSQIGFSAGLASSPLGPRAGWAPIVGAACETLYYLRNRGGAAVTP
jgi:hypothetical protein